MEDMQEHELFSDIDLSFTSTTSSSTSSARSSLSLSLDSFSGTSTVPAPLPHARASPHWSALRAAAALYPDGALRLHHLRLLRPLGSGNLARVFHCRIRHAPSSSPAADFALKVVDLAAGKGDRAAHVRTEARVLAALDHPFLPTLYARLDASHYACFLIDYCPGGDLHTLLRRRRRLPIPTGKFYAAEVLLAIEYLHALGFVYRDLKPENVLLRADGHVMLSDFDLCLQSDVTLALFTCTRPRPSSCCTASASDDEAELDFAAGPAAAHSKECVGTHEYLAPEVVRGAGHGITVDWWALGVLLYELIYGRTPFKGGTKESTLCNIASRELRFPGATAGRDEARARDLIGSLLVKDPARRLGSIRGASEIKRHSFFSGIKWPMIRNYRPPVIPRVAGAAEKGKKTRWMFNGGRFGLLSNLTKDEGVNKKMNFAA